MGAGDCRRVGDVGFVGRLFESIGSQISVLPDDQRRRTRLSLRVVGAVRGHPRGRRRFLQSKPLLYRRHPAKLAANPGRASATRHVGAGTMTGGHVPRPHAPLIAIVAITLVWPVLAAAQTRVVNFYNWSDYMAPTVLEDFSKSTGIKVRYETFDSNDTLETKLLAGKSGYDLVVPTGYFLERQIKAGVFLQLDKAKLPNLKYVWPEIANRLATYDPGNQYAVNYMWGTTGIGYNVAKARERLGPDGKIDSWDMVFKPDNLAKFKDCGVYMLDSSDDILPAALRYVGLNPSTTDPADYEKAAGLIMKIRPSIRKFHSSEY